MKEKILKTLFFVWVVLWAFLLARELFVKDRIRDYRILLSRSLDEKRSYVTGDRFYEFLSFCNRALPSDAGYRLIGPEDGSIEERRGAYYLYPHLEGAGSDFLLMFDATEPPPKGYEAFAALDGKRYVLKRKAM